jgi:hypothetical protein
LFEVAGDRLRGSRLRQVISSGVSGEVVRRIRPGFHRSDGSHQVSRYDDFFAFGGHSQFATGAVSRLSDQMSKDIPLRLLFEHPTVVELTQAIDGLPWSPGQEADRIRRLIAKISGQSGLTLREAAWYTGMPRGEGIIGLFAPIAMCHRVIRARLRTGVACWKPAH